MIKLKELKDNFNLEATFNLGGEKEFAGTLEGGKESLDRISLVLTQTFDAIGAVPFRQLVVTGKNRKVILVFFAENFLGVVAKRDENVENILKYIYEEESSLRLKAKVIEKKPEKPVIVEREKFITEGYEELLEEVKVKEPEKKEVKPIKIEAEKAEKIEAKKVEPEKFKEVIVKKAVLSPKVIEDIEEIAGSYLGDFSLDIVSNVIEDSGIDRNKPTKDQVLGIAQSLKDAASLIIGPSKAKKLKEDILKKIEEVE
jgi:hypothetical protein